MRNPGKLAVTVNQYAPNEKKGKAYNLVIHTPSGDISIMPTEYGIRLLSTGTPLCVLPQSSNVVEVLGTRDIEENVFKRACMMRNAWIEQIIGKTSRHKPLSHEEKHLLFVLKQRERNTLTAKPVPARPNAAVAPKAKKRKKP